MSPPQVDLLQRLITADRRYRQCLARKEPAHPDERGVEVSYLSGVHFSTARALVTAGLAEMLNLPGNGSPWVFLGSYEFYDEPHLAAR